MMSGISEIIKDESHLKTLKRLRKFRHIHTPFTDPDPYVYTYCQDECCDCIIRIQEKFIKNRRVPQIMDIEDFQLTF